MKIILALQTFPKDHKDQCNNIYSMKIAILSILLVIVAPGPSMWLVDKYLLY